MLLLNNLHPAAGAKKKKWILGRGIGSGNGKTCGKGTKGQNARSGSGMRPGFEGGQMPLCRRIPKRGFTNIFARKCFAVNVFQLNIFDDGQEVTDSVLKEVGLIPRVADCAKVLGEGSITKKVVLRVSKCSASAREKIVAAGGTVD
jgi:large subunit ribosomal protein L15